MKLSLALLVLFCGLSMSAKADGTDSKVMLVLTDNFDLVNPLYDSSGNGGIPGRFQFIVHD